METLPTLTAVIPSHKRLDRLPGLVTNYLDQGVDEIVIVLDGAHPGWSAALGKLADHPRVEVVELDPHRGLPLARKAGLEQASSDIVLMADDDVMPAPGMIDRHRAFHAAHPRSALLGYMPVALPARRGPDQAATYLYAQDYQNQAAEWEAGTSAGLLASFWGGNASLPRSLYLEAEEFKPSASLPYNEDLDLGMRLAEVGAGAAFDRQALGWHQHRRDLPAFLRECEVRGKAVAMLQRRWDSLPEQLSTLVEIPQTHPWLTRRVQARIGARDDAGALERSGVLAYRLAGRLRIWRLQDAIARLLRRGLAIRGYRKELRLSFQG